MRVLLIFLDGVGLGEDQPESNPFAAANYPTLHQFTNGKRWLNDTGIQITDRAVFIPSDTRFDIPGRPQSGTGQAAIVTGRKIPQIIGEHYGPKPNAATRDLINEGSIFTEIIQAGKTASLLEAYPQNWHDVINRGKRLPSSYQQAAASAGLPFFTADDLLAGHALSGDWTGEGWHTELNRTDIPIITPYQAGVRLVELSRQYDFAFFPHWITDVIGHRGSLEEAIKLLHTFDEVMRGVLDTWHDDEGLVIITSDHGNIEDLSHRKHTENPVPTLVIGQQKSLFHDLQDIAGIVPRIRLAIGS